MFVDVIVWSFVAYMLAILAMFIWFGVWETLYLIMYFVGGVYRYIRIIWEVLTGK